MNEHFPKYDEEPDGPFFPAAPPLCYLRTEAAIYAQTGPIISE